MEKKSLAKSPPDAAAAAADHLLWDSGSSLYDSFELKAFEQQLGSAIANSARAFSMPHLSDRRFPPPHRKLTPASKITRVLQRLIRSVFQRKSEIRNISNSTNFAHDRAKEAGFYYVFYDKSGSLSTIPEGSECDALLSPETRSFVRKTASERYTAATTATSFNGY
ncbi:uncharacterized protein LOC127250086 isoform X2 [Andrographis paniculata]|uniref:uncharacterized protein LOC127250086 isoform X2 n=1 Tax=Andrographis paniculata TaxID=175694 RepID=UPI0021E81681|nr:uncharacterized protein LOC127250086 isoform X2 [Andrographis paniculata]